MSRILKTTNSADVIFSVIILVVSLIALFSLATTDMPEYKSDPGPALIPLIGFSLLAITGTVQIIMARVGIGSDLESEYPKGAAARRVYITLAALGAYSFLLESIGYLISTSVLLIIINYLIGLRKLWKLALPPVVIAAITYYLFYDGLSIALPAGILRGVI